MRPTRTWFNQVWYMSPCLPNWAWYIPGKNLRHSFIARHCDVFYIGGTKVGAMFGEAVVFSGMKTPKYFFTNVKRHGALLAKGRMLGIQFDTLFTDNLYFKVSRHAIAMSERIRSIFCKHGIDIAYE